MSALSTKLRRDVWSLRGPAVAIAVVLGCGVAAYAGSRSTMHALMHTQAEFYRSARFGDVFAGATRAPARLMADIRAIPGVTIADDRVKGFASLDLEEFDEPVSALVVSLPDAGEPLLNGLYMVAGRLPEPGRGSEAVLSDAFAEAHGLRPGAHLDAVLRGRKRRLTIVGVARSPEFLYQVPPGAILPDFERFAVVWMRRAPAAAAFDLRGAFNDLSLRLASGTPVEPVLARVDALLEPYGGGNAVGREDQPSHFYISEELRQLRQITRVLPAMFIGVAVFLLAVVVGRLVQTQREQIATLKAFGYGTAAVARHYLGMVAVMVALGAALGIVLGAWMGSAMSELYAAFYRFPEIRYSLTPRVVLEAVGLAAAAALGAAMRSVWGAASLPPAVAMREPSPTRYRRSLVERLGLRGVGEPERMILRHLERRPVRALLSVAGVALACAIVLLGRFSGDAMTRMVDIQFGWAHREDLDVVFVDVAPDAARAELASLPGVQYAEGYRTVGVDLVVGPRRHTTAIVGMGRRGDLSRVLDAELRPVELPPAGLVLADHLAERLGVGVGDSVRVELLEGDRRERVVVVSRLVREYLGAGVYMERRALNRLLGEGDRVSGAWLAVDQGALSDIVLALDRRPGVLRATALPQARAALEETFVRSAGAFGVILTLLAVAIAGGVLYNTARLTLAERSRELASMRVLGFTTAEIGYLFFGELALLTLIALPAGLALGTAFCYVYIDGLQTDIIRIPFVLTRASYAFTAAVILGAAGASAIPMYRRLKRLDLVAVLKVRE